MKRRSFISLLLFPAVAHAHSNRIGDIAIGHSWALPTSGPDGQVFFPLVNNGNSSDELIAARSEICALIEFRQNNRYSELPLNSILLEPGKPIPMRPTARHLRLVELKRPLNEYESFKMILDFLNAGEIEINVIIEPSSSE